MKLAIIGASGFVGSALLSEALTRGHQVTAIVRHPEKIETTDAQLTVKTGDAQDADSIAQLVAGHDAVLSAYNPGWTDPNLYNAFLKGAAAIEAGTQQANVSRLLVIGGAGSLEIAPGVQLVDTPEFPAEYKPGATAARDYLNTIRNNTILDWTYVSPAMDLFPGERTGTFRIGTNQPVFSEQGTCRISVADLAVAVLNETEQPHFSRERFTIGY